MLNSPRTATVAMTLVLAMGLHISAHRAVAQHFAPLGTDGEMQVRVWGGYGIPEKFLQAQTPTSGPFDEKLEIVSEEYVEIMGETIVLRNIVRTRQAVAYSGHRIDLALSGSASSHADFTFGPPHYLICSAEQQFEMTFQVHATTPFAMNPVYGFENPFAFDPDGDPIPPYASHGYGWSTPKMVLDIETSDGLIEWDPYDGHPKWSPAGILGSNLLYADTVGGFFPPDVMNWTGVIHPGTYTLTFEVDAFASEDFITGRIFPTIIIPEPAVAGLVLPAVLLLGRRRRRHR